MNNEKDINADAIGRLAVEIGDRFKLINCCLRGHNELLRHVAAASIHMAMFMRDVYNKIDGNITNVELDKRFLSDCGCNFNNKNH